jgi:hypothetical protein
MITVQIPKGFFPRGEGWILWGGGDYPVHLDTDVEVSYRGPYPPSRGAASTFLWSHHPTEHDRDIVAYRVIKNEPESDGRIPWNGGRCPVPGDTLVEVELREGGCEEWMKNRAIHFEWGHDEEFPKSDIVAYRILPQYNPEDVAFGPRDTQVGGTHYAEMKIQPWDAINVWSTPEMVLGYHINTSVSYLARFRAKGGLQDIKKAHHHLSELIRYFEEQEEYPF